MGRSKVGKRPLKTLPPLSKQSRTPVSGRFRPADSREDHIMAFGFDMDISDARHRNWRTASPSIRTLTGISTPRRKRRDPVKADRSRSGDVGAKAPARIRTGQTDGYGCRRQSTSTMADPNDPATQPL